MCAQGTIGAFPWLGMTRSAEERSALCAEIEQYIGALPENHEKGRLRGACLRLRQALEDAERFEAELQKLAALSEKVARATAAVRLSEFVRTAESAPEGSSSAERSV
jgi:hypothetical protein